MSSREARVDDVRLAERRVELEGERLAGLAALTSNGIFQRAQLEQRIAQRPCVHARGAVRRDVEPSRASTSGRSIRRRLDAATRVGALPSVEAAVGFGVAALRDVLNARAETAEGGRSDAGGHPTVGERAVEALGVRLELRASLERSVALTSVTAIGSVHSSIIRGGAVRRAAAVGTQADDALLADEAFLALAVVEAFPSESGLPFTEAAIRRL